ncbi:hypothetical protein AVEN_129358-1 [Araneus ventricosus]|uniref:RNase H type-1 domain-containing protein n=1 Tax=Araneus ventricosus TaxID=182803 RepID=A0A4Y2QSY7_ARAVE|nr:hypothetical protein AVEN_129358-1 [Araneus ventricosus]
MSFQDHIKTTKTLIINTAEVSAQNLRRIWHHPNSGSAGHGRPHPPAHEKSQTGGDTGQDGFKIEKQTSSSFCARKNENIIKTWRAKLSPANAIFQVETLALNAVIEWANTTKKEVTIWKENESGLQALKSFSTKNTIIQKAQMAQLTNVKVSLKWVKAP